MRLVVLYDTADSYANPDRFGYEPVFQKHSSIQSIASGLEGTGHEVEVFQWQEQDITSCLEHLNGAHVINFCMGLHGDMKMSLVPMLLDQAGISYFGNTAKAHLLCSDKSLTKQQLEAHGLRVPQALVLQKHTSHLAHDWAEHFGFPLILKPTNSLFSTDLTLLHSISEMESCIEQALSRHNALLLEQYIEGQEYQVGILREHSGVIQLRLVDEASVFSFWHKSDPSRFTYDPEVPQHLVEPLCALGRKAFDLLEMKDVARFDMKVDSEGTPWMIEANSSPSITWGVSALGLAVERGGLSESGFYRSLTKV